MRKNKKENSCKMQVASYKIRILFKERWQPMKITQDINRLVGAKPGINLPIENNNKKL